jgi:hypothetical protein
MFIEIKYNKVKQNLVQNFVQDNVNTYKSELHSEINITFIESIINNNINIQIALAYQYYFQREFDLEVASSITLDENISVKEATNDLMSIFKDIVIPYDESGNPYIVQLKGINKTAKEIFQNMILSGKVNPILSYFSLEKPFVKDCNKTSFYEYTNSKKLTKQSDYIFFCDNKYIKHILSTNKDFTCSSFINVSGFSMDELNKSLYVYYLSSLVSNLYLFIIEYEFNGRLYYIKQLRWYK